VVGDPVAVRVDPSGDVSVQTRFPVAGSAMVNALRVLPGANVVGWLRFSGVGVNRFLVPMGMVMGAVYSLEYPK
jgi:hypothetical protein